MIASNYASRVLFLNSRSGYEGTDICLLEMVREMDKGKVVPYIVLPHDGPLVEDMRKSGAAEIIFAEMNPLQRPESLLDVGSFLFKFLPSVWRIARIIRKYSIDVVYTNSSAIQTGAVAAYLCGKPHIWHVREIWSSPQIVGRVLYWIIYHLSDHIVAITDTVWLKNFPTRKKKITRVYDGVRVRLFREAKTDYDRCESYRIPSNAIIVGVVGKLIPAKGQNLLLKAARRVCSLHSNVHVVVIGDIPRPMYQSYRDELLSYVEEAEIADRVHFVGWSKDVFSWLKLFNVLVVPSTHPEGLGAVILEAWASGVPVIASNHGGPAEIVQHGENGLLFEPGNAKQLGAALEMVITDDTLRIRLMQKGYETVCKSFDSKVNTKSIEKIICDIVERSA
jgi:glycosyltransferase involved in cell wall biosynthesis